MRKPRAPKAPHHIVNHTAFTDARPTIGGKSTTYNPGAKSPLPGGAPRFINVAGVRTKSVSSDPSLTNKRY